ncbi:MAG: hypothetical protein IJK49_01825 [Prevotella sp.]|nr:hypothetical protein [Prevotella sp.]
MNRYCLTNWKTSPFREKSFEGQLDRFAIACVVSADNPNRVLEVVPIFRRESNYGLAKIIGILHKKELGLTLDEQSLKLLNELSKPIWGDFVEMGSIHGPLKRMYTREEADCGLCTPDNVGKYELNTDGSVKEYNSIKVFTMKDIDGSYLKGWCPDDMYSRYIYHRYFPINDPTW